MAGQESNTAVEVPFVSGPVEYQFGSRAFTHSLLAQTVLGYAAWPLLPFSCRFVWLKMESFGNSVKHRAALTYYVPDFSMRTILILGGCDLQRMARRGCSPPWNPSQHLVTI